MDPRHSSAKSFKLVVLTCAAILLIANENLIKAVEIVDCAGDKAISRIVGVGVNNGVATCGDQDSYCEFVQGRNASIAVDFETSK